MSYDLFFLVPPGRAPLTREEFAAYFTSRPHYEVSDQQALYQHEKTGVYGTFDYGGPTDADAGDGRRSAGVSFNLNYVRPHAFGLELAPELAAFVEHFHLEVEDPQTEGMKGGVFSEEGFLRAWNHGNRFGYRASKESLTETATMPTADIERHWRWNYGVEPLQASYGEQVFVARIFFLRRGAAVDTMAAWPDGIPAALPEVDWIAVAREELAPRGFLGFGGAKPDLALVPFAEIAAKGRRKDGHWLLCVPERTKEIESYIRGLKPTRDKPQGIAFDQVLNRELLG